MNRICAYFGFLTCLMWSLLPLSAGETQTFTNDAGQTIEAELLELKSGGTIVAIRMANGHKVDARLSAFSHKDQGRIEAWWEGVQASQQLLSEEAKLNVVAKMNRKSKNNERHSHFSNVDDKTTRFFPEVLIENEELDAFTDNEVRIVIVAEDLRFSDRKLIVSASTIKTDLLDRQKTVLEGDSFRLRLYEYDGGYDYKRGYAYEGYIVVIKNSAGEVTHTRATKTKYLSNLPAIYSCKAGEVYDEGINQKLNVTPNSYFIN